MGAQNFRHHSSLCDDKEIQKSVSYHWNWCFIVIIVYQSYPSFDWFYYAKIKSLMCTRNWLHIFDKISAIICRLFMAASTYKLNNSACSKFYIFSSIVDESSVAFGVKGRVIKKIIDLLINPRREKKNKPNSLISDLLFNEHGTSETISWWAVPHPFRRIECNWNYTVF